MRDFKLVLDDLLLEIRQSHPKLKIKFKDESKFQQFIGKIAKPINKEYLTQYTTVMGNTIWFPSRDLYEKNPRQSATILLHEWIHLYDRRRFPILFDLSYILMLPCVFTMRGHWERRGYAADIMMAIRRGIDPVAIYDYIHRIFSGSAYLFMCPFKKQNNRFVSDIINNPPDDYPYDRISYYIDRLWGDTI